MKAAGILASTFLLLVPGAAEAAACCLSTSAFGSGRLAIWEEAAAGVSGTWLPTAGRWDEEGRWHDPAGTEAEARATAWGILRLSPSLEASLRVPWVFGARAAGGIAEEGHGLGDVSAAVRWEALAIGAFRELPGIALVAGVTAPTGREVAASETILGADVTGRGAWVLSAGASLERAHDPWFVRLDAAFLLPLPSTVDGRTRRFGPGAEVLLGGGVEATSGLVLSVAPRFSWEAPLRLDGVAVPGSGAWELGVGPAASLRLGPHWTVQASYETGIFADGLGDNRPGKRSLTAGVRHGIF